MKNYKDLTPKQQQLCNKLWNAIQRDEDINDILKSDGIQDILNAYAIPSPSNITFLIHAIINSSKTAASAILNTANSSVLKELLTTEFIIYSEDNTQQKKHTALSYAQKEGYTDLAKTIEQKMRDLRLEVSNVSQMKESKDIILGLKFIEHKINDTINDLFWAVLKRDTEAANKILGTSNKNPDGWDIFFLRMFLQSGLMKMLFISDEKVRELAGKDSETIIKTIQQRQAAVLSIGGALLLAGGITAGMFVSPLFAIAAIGLAVCLFAVYHGLKQLPSTEVSGIQDPNLHNLSNNLHSSRS